MAERLIFRKLDQEEKMELAKLLSRAVEDESGFHPIKEQNGKEDAREQANTEEIFAREAERIEP